MKLKSKTGFTLIELLVVTFMVALIATLSLTNYREGEKRRQVGLAADGLVNALTSAQNYTLTGRRTNNAVASCRTAEYYFVNVGYIINTYTLSARNNCGGDDIIESYSLPPNTRVATNGLVVDNSVANSSVQINFTLPFGVINKKIDAAANFSAFTTATFTVSSTDGQSSKSVKIDGLSGRIEQ